MNRRISFPTPSTYQSHASTRPSLLRSTLLASLFGTNTQTDTDPRDEEIQRLKQLLSDTQRENERLTSENQILHCNLQSIHSPRSDWKICEHSWTSQNLAHQLSDMSSVVDILADAPHGLLDTIKYLIEDFENSVIESRIRNFTYIHTDSAIDIKLLKDTNKEVYANMEREFQTSKVESEKIRNFVQENVMNRWTSINENYGGTRESSEIRTGYDKWFDWGSYMDFNDCKLCLTLGTRIELYNPLDRADRDRITIPHSSEANDRVRRIMDTWKESFEDTRAMSQKGARPETCAKGSNLVGIGCSCDFETLLALSDKPVLRAVTKVSSRTSISNPSM
ncbi:hypothetical protein L486_08433 [Kwoniella mangroviensis CBS 10435]|uniref:Uncharacterized protein n=1 Tax=Kwoniella mangroviensis CBS 10435 TaxID=1331196 RepID=A0A1B9IF51_9TREE|nr:hypothetical protein L486_08433 [Kwoniella mangroviensis CBS 10435]